MIGHEALYQSLNRNYDYLLDRLFYTTIIRLNYEMGINITETAKEILSIPLEISAVIYLHPDKDVLISRLKLRNDLNLYNEDFNNYENEVFTALSSLCDKIILVNNYKEFSILVPEIQKELVRKKVYLKEKQFK